MSEEELKNDPAPVKVKKKEKDKKPSKGIETMYRVTYRNHINLSDIADKKANMMISINSILLSAIIAVVSSGLAFEFTKLEHFRFAIPLAMLLITCLLSIIFAIISARSNVTHRRVDRKQLTDKKASILFFGNFSELSLDEFLTDLDYVKDNDELLYANMSIDIYYLGKVLTKKYRQLKVSYNIFMYGLILTVLSLLFILAYSFLWGETSVLPN